MRNFLFLFILTLALTACASPSNSPISQSTSNSAITSAPTQFSLGKCVDVRQPTPNPDAPSLFAKISEADHILGSSSASVTILVYSDFQCASCANLAPLLKSFVQKYPKDVRIVFRNFPLISIHDKAAISAQAAEVASMQGKFWQMHDFLFSKQGEWSTLKPTDFQKWIIQQSATLGLDSTRFESDLTNPQVIANVQKAWDDGQKIQLPGAPIILINGEIIKWQVKLLDQLEILVKLAMLPKKQFNNCPSVIIDPAKKYTAILKTNKGDITIKLMVDQAPNTVNNFIFLAKNGWFDNNPFVQNFPGFEVLTGDPSGTGLGGPGYFIRDEPNNLLFDRSGMVAMKNSGPDTNGSLFFISLSPNSNLNSQYTIFGEVTGGMEVAKQLASKNSGQPTTPTPPDILKTVVIEEK